ncbi:VQ motif-containing protein 1-like [Canna indica]|uniref:VQ motif-containing protein 1-like n=1 Tax=Canna indica TaxID=4628 RepID=A0AAQ3K5A0_9LILI|nr:VQ motif-containing protein 1-like [Canna indica]
MSSGVGGMTRPAKVRVIVTKFVEANAREFKSVVQCLTGKDSVIAEALDGFEKMDAAAGRSCGRGRKRQLAVAGFDDQVRRPPAEVKVEEGDQIELLLPDELFEFLRD